jgi:hypothetical protein
MGEAVKETKTDRREEEGFVISQCIFVLPTITNAVSLRLVQRGGGEDARDPRTVWQETFERDLAKAEKRKKAPPQRVPNVGDEAFWLGGRETGRTLCAEGKPPLPAWARRRAESGEKDREGDQARASDSRTPLGSPFAGDAQANPESARRGQPRLDGV